MLAPCSCFCLVLFTILPSFTLQAANEHDTEPPDRSRLINLYNVRYLKCVDEQQIYTSSMFVSPLSQTQLTSPGPIECALTCKASEHKNHTYTYAIMHVPAKGKFVNKLVCGCGSKHTLEGASRMPDDHCHLPCPQGGNATVNAADLRNKKQQQKREEQSPKETRLNLPRRSGSSGSSNSKGPPQTNRQSCGNGLGLLSAYEIIPNSGLPIAIPSVPATFLSPAILSWLIILSLSP